MFFPFTSLNKYAKNTTFKLFIRPALYLNHYKRMLFALIFRCTSALFVMKMILVLFGWWMTQSFLNVVIYPEEGQENTSPIIQIIKINWIEWQKQIILKTITLHHLHLI